MATNPSHDEEFKRALSDAQRRMEEKLINTAASIIQHVVPLTPVGESRPGYTGGRLRKAWELKRVSPKHILIYNNVHYGVHVEFGHRTRLGKSKYGKDYGNTRADGTPKISYVDGRYMLAEAVDKALKENK